MAVDPMMDAMASKLQASRAKIPQAQPVGTAPDEALGVISEIKSHLQAAMDLLGNLGAADQAEGENA